MSTTILNEHDANQGAQSKGEFLGMTGNSGWYLLGSAGMTVMMVIVLWGVFGVSLLLCVMVGVVLCLMSVTYVFTLKNNKPNHYDTDFFESALVEAGLVELTFGPRARRASNPFSALTDQGEEMSAPNAPKPRRESPVRHHGTAASQAATAASVTSKVVADLSGDRTAKPSSDEKEPVVALAEYEKLRADFVDVEERLEEALLEREED